MALSGQLALAIGVSVIGHTGVLIAASFVPPSRSAAARPAMEMQIIQARPKAVGATAGEGAEQGPLQRTRTVIAESGTVPRAAADVPHSHASGAVLHTHADGATPHNHAANAAPHSHAADTAPQNPAADAALRSPAADAALRGPAADAARRSPAGDAAADGAAADVATLAPTGVAPAGAHDASAADAVVPGAVIAGGSARLGNGRAAADAGAARPRYRVNPPPEYPIAARRRREQGTVMLRVVVTSDGRAASVALEKSCGSEALDASAARAVRGWVFDPAIRDGVAVDSTVTVPVRFALDR